MSSRTAMNRQGLLLNEVILDCSGSFARCQLYIPIVATNAKLRATNRSNMNFG